jgi:general secretion pathway protein D
MTSGGPGVSPQTPKPASIEATRLQWKAPSEVKVGESFEVMVNVNSDAALRGLPLEIAYPSNLLEVVAISEGSFLKQGDGATSFVQANNQATGRLNVGLLRNDSTGASGEGTLVQIQFKAKAAGAIQLSFTSARPIGAEGAVSLEPLPKLDIVSK